MKVSLTILCVVAPHLIAGAPLQSNTSPNTRLKRAFHGIVAPDYNEAAVFDTNSWPFIVSIRDFQANGYESYMTAGCGGSFIYRDWVLSAAHCFNGHTGFVNWVDGDYYTLGMDVRFGFLNKNYAQGHSCRVDMIISHPEYNATTQTNDLALVSVDCEPNIMQYIRTVALPYNSLDTLTEGDQVAAAGWGTTSFRGNPSAQLLFVNLVITNHKKCNAQYMADHDQNGVIDENDETHREPETRDVIVDETMICAWGKGKDTCQGDSGGPLVSYSWKRNAKVLYGVVSFGNDGAKDLPGVYTNVARYVDWIHQTTGRKK